MRILYSHRVQSRDGQAVHIDELVGAFRDAGHDVLVVGPPSYQKAEFGAESSVLAAIRSRLPGFIYEILELLYNIPVSMRLRRAMKYFKPDFVYERYNLFFFGGLILKRMYGLPFHLEINSPLAQERAIHGRLVFKRLAARLERYNWRNADHTYPVTGVIADQVAALGISRATITINQNGVDLERYRPGPARHAANSPITLGFVGFMRSWHGIDTVISLLAEEADARSMKLLLVGDGPARPELEEQATTLGLQERVVFLGLVQHDRIPEIVGSFDIALQPRVVAYASPLKIFEYMALGRAIVAPDQPNIREVLSHEQDALLFDPNDPTAMRAAVLRLARDPELRARLGNAAREEIISRDYTWAGNARRVLAVAEPPANRSRGAGV
jgi:glycosyltransferase involved in cell wall biosynthesis